MSEAVDLNLLGKMVSRLQAGMEGVRQDYAGVRASLTTMDTRFAEFGLRMSSLELAQMKLAASFDEMHGKFDRFEVDLAGVTEKVTALGAGVKEAVTALGARVNEAVTALGARVERIEARLDGLESKLDLILSRLSDR
ncbi:MAG TPA: hypothetical protein VIJ55_11010 [Acetobacteraceae bacterium]